jgi:hypothetical protein
MKGKTSPKNCSCGYRIRGKIKVPGVIERHMAGEHHKNGKQEDKKGDATK